MGPRSRGQQPTACRLYRVATRNNSTSSITISTPAQAFEDVLSGAGTTLPVQDKIDEKIVQELATKS